MCIECGKFNATKVEVDKHKIIHAKGKKLSCEQCGKAFTQKFVLDSIQELLLGKNHIYISHQCEKKNHKAICFLPFAK